MIYLVELGYRAIRVDFWSQWLLEMRVRFKDEVEFLQEKASSSNEKDSVAWTDRYSSSFDPVSPKVRESHFDYEIDYPRSELQSISSSVYN